MANSKCPASTTRGPGTTKTSSATGAPAGPVGPRRMLLAANPRAKTQIYSGDGPRKQEALADDTGSNTANEESGGCPR